jgi:hypothetical protein
LPLALLVAAMSLVACGGSDKKSSSGGGTSGGQPVSTDTDVNTILDKTFTGDKTVNSAKLNMTLDVNVSGGSSGVSGPFKLTITGPFQSDGAKKLPKFDIDVSGEGAGQTFKAGLESTGTKGFVNYQGTEYAVPDQYFQQFKSGFEQAQGQSSSTNTLSKLGIKPQDWLTNPKASDSSVEGTDTVKITGGVDIAKFLDDISTVLSKSAGSLGSLGSQVPSSLTADQKKQVEDSIKSATVEIESGKDDSILRRFAVNLSAADPSGSGGKFDLTLDISLSGVGEDQTISEPSNVQPFEQLLPKLQGLSQLGALGGLGG